MTSTTRPKEWYQLLYVQVLLAVFAGVLVGYYYPKFGTALKPLGDAFVRLIKMIIAPLIFCTVVHGIASMGDLKKLGRVGFKSLLYFEVVSTLALLIGLVVVNVWKPGEGFNIDPKALDPSMTKGFVQSAHAQTVTQFLLNIIPASFFDAFAKGDLLQVLLVSILTALSLAWLGPKGAPILRGIEYGSSLFFGIIHLIVKLAPIGAFGAMAFTVGSFGMNALGRLLIFMLSFYTCALIFVFVVLGSIAYASGFSLWKFLKFIKEEIFLVFGTSSSEPALPGLIEKMRRLGCAESTVGLVIPTGYSFNLDGTNIYLTMAAVFLAQATNTPLGLKEQIVLLLVAMVSSKGASAVTGAGFITLAATLAAVPSVPIEALGILLGIDRFMSECRAVTNLIGNGVATIVISRWEGEVSATTIRENLDGQKAAQ